MSFIVEEAKKEILYTQFEGLIKNKIKIDGL
jgi:hypothetical protein